MNNKLNEDYTKKLDDINSLNKELEKQNEIYENIKLTYENEINKINNDFQEKLNSLNVKYKNDLNNLEGETKILKNKNNQLLL